MLWEDSSISTYVDCRRPRRFFVRHRVYGREGEPCLVCKTPIKRVVIRSEVATTAQAARPRIAPGSGFISGRGFPDNPKATFQFAGIVLFILRHYVNYSIGVDLGGTNLRSQRRRAGQPDGKGHVATRTCRPRPVLNGCAGNSPRFDKYRPARLCWAWHRMSQLI